MGIRSLTFSGRRPRKRVELSGKNRALARKLGNLISLTFWAIRNFLKRPDMLVSLNDEQSSRAFRYVILRSGADQIAMRKRDSIRKLNGFPQHSLFPGLLVLTPYFLSGYE